MALATGRVVGQFVLGVVDGADVDQEPDIIPAQGTVTFSGAAPYIPLVDASPNPVTLMTTSIVAVLDSEGYLCTPDPFDPTKPGTRGIRLFANDDPSSPVQGWTWTVTYRFAVSNGATPTIPAHSIAVLSGAELDLTTVVKVPASPGVGEAQAFALVDRAEAAAVTAEAIAQSIRDDANNGVFDGAPGTPGADGDDGAPGNATIRFATTAGRAAYLATGPGTEQLIYGDTGWRDISSLLANGWTAGSVQLQREGGIVSLYISGLNGAAATSIQVLNLPLGFRPNNSASSSARPATGTTPVYITTQSTGLVQVAMASVTNSNGLEIVFRTTNTWPTTLPGTAVGTIPTL